MGFVYTINPITNRRVLCCDKCDNYPAVKHKCPFNYCQDYALCSKCWNEVKINWKETHLKAGCKEGHEDFIRRKNKEKELLEKGLFIRKWALGEKENMVRVGFKNKEGIEKVFLMNEETYHQFKTLEITTIEDYQGKGKITEIKGECIK